jgi:hypothetical protein
MGRIVTPKYRMEVKTNVGSLTPAAWRGRVTSKRLADHVEGLNQSFQPGGINAHVSDAKGAVMYVYAASIIEQRTGRVVAEWKAAPFQVM